MDHKVGDDTQTGRRRAGVPGQVWSLEQLEVTGGVGNHGKGNVEAREGKPLFQGFPPLLRTSSLL